MVYVPLFKAFWNSHFIIPTIGWNKWTNIGDMDYFCIMKTLSFCLLLYRSWLVWRNWPWPGNMVRAMRFISPRTLPSFGLLSVQLDAGVTHVRGGLLLLTEEEGVTKTALPEWRKAARKMGRGKVSTLRAVAHGKRLRFFSLCKKVIFSIDLRKITC